MIAIFEHQFFVNDDVLDGNGHVNNVVYVQWMQDLGILHAEANGCTREVYQRLGVSWVARSHHIEYVRSALPNDVIKARSWLDETRKVSCRRRYLFTRESPNGSPRSADVIVRAETEWVYIDVKSGRPRKIDAEIMDRFRILAGPDFGE